MREVKLIFHPLEFVGRGSETQLQVGENLNISFSKMKEIKNNLNIFVAMNPTTQITPMHKLVAIHSMNK